MSTLIRIVTLAAGTWLAACATVPPPTDELAQAQALLQSAGQADAATYAPLELGSAQQKLNQAQAGAASGENAIAADLAVESQADSELARAKARLGKARDKVKQQTQENTRLRARLLGDDTQGSSAP